MKKGSRVFCSLCGKEFHTYTKTETRHEAYKSYDVDVVYPNSDECHLLQDYVCNDCYDNLANVVKFNMIKAGEDYEAKYTERKEKLKRRYEKQLEELNEKNEEVRRLTEKIRVADMTEIAKDERYSFTGIFPYSTASSLLKYVDNTNIE